MDPGQLPAAHKAIATAVALTVLWTWEYRVPAHSEGRGGLGHDLRNLALGGANALMVAALLAWVLPMGGGPGGLLGLLGGGGVLGAVVGLLGLDLWMYVWHRANHQVPFLWRFHRMHHADPNMDASTGVRFHPGEVLMGTLLRVPVAFALGITAGHVVLYEFILLPILLFHHSNARVPERLDRVLRVVIVTPGFHRVHHSPRRVETDSNYSSVLTIWDRIARTVRWRDPPPWPWKRYGLTGMGARDALRLPGMLALPFRR